MVKGQERWFFKTTFLVFKAFYFDPIEAAGSLKEFLDIAFLDFLLPICLF